MDIEPRMVEVFWQTFIRRVWLPFWTHLAELWHGFPVSASELLPRMWFVSGSWAMRATGMGTPLAIGSTAESSTCALHAIIFVCGIFMFVGGTFCHGVHDVDK